MADEQPDKQIVNASLDLTGCETPEEAVSVFAEYVSNLITDLSGKAGIDLCSLLLTTAGALMDAAMKAGHCGCVIVLTQKAQQEAVRRSLNEIIGGDIPSTMKH